MMSHLLIAPLISGVLVLPVSSLAFLRIMRSQWHPGHRFVARFTLYLFHPLRCFVRWGELASEFLKEMQGVFGLTQPSMLEIVLQVIQAWVVFDFLVDLV